jgi:uncharacterized ferredoxin-like protein
VDDEEEEEEEVEDDDDGDVDDSDEMDGWLKIGLELWSSGTCGLSCGIAGGRSCKCAHSVSGSEQVDEIGLELGDSVTVAPKE